MEGLSDTLSSVNVRMEELEVKRESSVAASRVIIRKTKRAIHSIHLEEDAAPMIAELHHDMRKMAADLDSEPEILYSGPVADAMMEYAEACILSAIVSESPIPSYDCLGITPQAWMMGLADCVGELRRIVLSLLMKGDIEKATSTFGEMEEIGSEILMFDVPDAILPIRRKQDVTRGIMEKTRADLTNAILMDNFRK